jgi:CheY-like chemotaxis protein
MNNARILVVEDTPANLELVTDLLEIAGYHVLTATAAESGLELARRERPDLILMDVGLPGMDGLEAARRLRDDPATVDIPGVALTARAMRGDEALARAAGCRAYLSKPIDTRNFVRRVAELLATRDPDPPKKTS